MRNLLVLIGIFALVSLFCGCEKDESVQPGKESEMAMEGNDLEEIKHALKSPVKSEKMLETSGVPTFEEILSIINREDGNSEGDISLRSTGVEPLTRVPGLNCGEVVRGDNFSGRNKYTGGLYQKGCLGSYYPFTANDKEYIISLNQTQTIEVSMTGLASDLDMFLFSLDHLFFPVACLDKSANSGTSNEHISITLPRGTYAVIIDGWRSDQQSQFTLSLNCVQDDCENFDRLPQGDITRLSGNWVKWNPRSLLDAQVTNRQSYSRSNSVQIRTIDNYEPDVTRLFGDRTHGKYKVAWKMYVPRGQNATFNVKKFSNPQIETGVAVFLTMDGGIAFQAKNRYSQSYLRYNQDRWVDVEMFIDLDRETTILYIENAPVAKWRTRTINRSTRPGYNRFAGINFWAYHSFTNFYVDDVCFEQNPSNMPDYHYTPAQEL